MTQENIRLHTTEGMPPLELSNKITSIFEFWPLWVMYLPVVCLWLLLSLRYRSLSLPLVSNPEIPLSGMIGSSKSEILAAANENSQQWILPWIRHKLSNHSEIEQIEALEQRMRDADLDYPIVAKPDMGCRGAGVDLLKNRGALKEYMAYFPVGSCFMLQKLGAWEPEAGIFYVRYPDQHHGKIISMALKYSPYVVGDGQRTLNQLIEADPRASRVKHLYETRHRDKLEEIIPEGEAFRLVFSASHCRGAVFRDGTEFVSKRLTERLDEIMDGFPEFYYGRLDIKFRDIESLMNGEDLQIIEVNGASSESLHIWDSHANLKDAWSVLLNQFIILFRIGHQNRQRGYKPPGLIPLYKAWKKESDLTKGYPNTH